jgi:hypothetical protein
MKHFTFFPLSPFGFKYAGALLTVAGLVLFILLNSNYQFIIYAGMLVMVFSKERHESEYVAAVRSEIFKSVLGFTLSLTIALNLTGWLAEDFSAELPPLYYIGFPLFLYLILFYGSLLLKIEPDSSADFVENAKRFPRVVIPWMLLVLAVLLFLLLRYWNVI